MNSKDTKILIIALIVVSAMLGFLGIANIYQRHEIVQQDKQIAVISEEKTELEKKFEFLKEIVLNKTEEEGEIVSDDKPGIIHDFEIQEIWRLQFLRDYVKDNFKGVKITVEKEVLDDNLGTFNAYYLIFPSNKNPITLISDMEKPEETPLVEDESGANFDNKKRFSGAWEILEYIEAMKNGQKFRKEE